MSMGCCLWETRCSSVETEETLYRDDHEHQVAPGMTCGPKGPATVEPKETHERERALLSP